MVEAEARIQKIEGGYTIYGNCKTYFRDTLEKALTVAGRILEKKTVEV